METHQLSRQEAESLLLSLQQLENNEVFKIFRAIAQNLYDAGVNSLIQSAPDSIASFARREQALGGLQELKRFLDQPATMREDLNQQIENKHNA